MVRTLFLARHASALTAPSNDDFNRKLSELGLRQSQSMGAWLLQHSPSLEGIYASSSARTKSTTQFICAILNIKEGINFDLDYYQASRKMMVEKLCQISTSLKNILIVAHNPGVTQLLNFLCPNQAAYLDPADIVHIEFNEIAWNEITEDSGIFVRRVSFRD
jgi:phosphohistidine phosphatase|tara:strand:- start:1299 stop:1784 length:486 start_codon:yes stop_codon:yes gene_type:complete